ncbi:MAG TPA: DEAD/DEAH box helicase, partial [Gammaproteobacteria bacterium]|nr:DEAD/DEAH box helicase [Gammaproteobacteria bacterium]
MSKNSSGQMSVFNPQLPHKAGDKLQLGCLYGSSDALAICQIAQQHDGLLIVATEDMSHALRMASALQFFLGKNSHFPILSFPDWETLPYDVFSPHQDIISQRLETLYRLPQTKRGILVAPINMLMQRLAPPEFLKANSLFIDVGDEINLQTMRQQLESCAYICVPQVMEHGEFAVRGSILDLFPTGSKHPIRIDLFDKEVDSIRLFDPETQRTIKKIDHVRLMPAREFPFTKEAISFFRQRWRETFEGDPSKTQVYKAVSQGIAPNGIEYYLPLFFPKTSHLFQYIPKSALFVFQGNTEQAAEQSWNDIVARYEQRRGDTQRPILPPDALYLNGEKLFEQLRSYRQIQVQSHEIDTSFANDQSTINMCCQKAPELNIMQTHNNQTPTLFPFLEKFSGKLLITAETEGRREMIMEILRDHDISPAKIDGWQSFLAVKTRVNICIASLDEGLCLKEPEIVLLSESQLFGERVQQRRRRKAASKNNDAIIKNLTELSIGSPVVHQELGVGRYLGLQKLSVGGFDSEFLSLEYAGGDKLYVPVASLHLISRYTGSAPEKAPLHKLGTDQWDKARRKAAQKVNDVAAELLAIFAKREASRGHTFHFNETDYLHFSDAFPFEETPDQQTAIENVIRDMKAERPMDRVVCGDVGFGKTEVAMRAAFIAANDGKQICVLVPTTLLAQQHYQNFCDRFADWPVRVEVMSRFNSKKQSDAIIADLAAGKVDIVIGTHKLLSDTIKYKNLGLMIVDEEHRFGVRQKEKIKAVAANLDLLTLTATPIPRTLNMSLA